MRISNETKIRIIVSICLIGAFIVVNKVGLTGMLGLIIRIALFLGLMGILYTMNPKNEEEEKLELGKKKKFPFFGKKK